MIAVDFPACPKCEYMRFVWYKGKYESGTKKYYCNRCNLTFAPHPLRAYKIPDNIRKQAVKLALRGYGSVEISKRLGVSRISVWRWSKVAFAARDDKARKMHERGAVIWWIAYVCKMRQVEVKALVREHHSGKEPVRVAMATPPAPGVPPVEIRNYIVGGFYTMLLAQERATHRLYSLVINLDPVSGGVIGKFPMQHTQAFFLSMYSDEVATILHEPNQRRPYTVSPVMHSTTSERVATGSLVYPGGGYYVRITLLDGQLFGQMAKTLEWLKGKPVAIGGIEYRVLSMQAQDNPWAWFTSFEDLDRVGGTSRHIELEFATPTAFNIDTPATTTKKRYHILPNPDRLLDSLVTSWNVFGPPEMRIDTVRKRAICGFAAQNMTVANYSIRTESVEYDKWSLRGFVGTTSFFIDSGVTEMVKQINMLADFATFSGVGCKTALGMGQVRRVRK